jgi:hypothetical protein
MMPIDREGRPPADAPDVRGADCDRSKTETQDLCVPAIAGVVFLFI